MQLGVDEGRDQTVWRPLSMERGSGKDKYRRSISPNKEDSGVATSYDSDKLHSCRGLGESLRISNGHVYVRSNIINVGHVLMIATKTVFRVLS